MVFNIAIVHPIALLLEPIDADRVRVQTHHLEAFLFQGFIGGPAGPAHAYNQPLRIAKVGGQLVGMRHTPLEPPQPVF